MVSAYRAMVDHVVPASPCPWCGVPVDLVTSLHEEGPGPGDVSVCEVCSRVAIYSDAVRLERPGPGALEALCAADPDFARELALYHAVAEGIAAGRAGPVN